MSLLFSTHAHQLQGIPNVNVYVRDCLLAWRKRSYRMEGSRDVALAK